MLCWSQFCFLLIPETLLPGNTYSAAGSSSPGITDSKVCFHTAAEGDGTSDPWSSHWPCLCSIRIHLNTCMNMELRAPQALTSICGREPQALKRAKTPHMLVKKYTMQLTINVHSLFPPHHHSSKEILESPLPEKQ